MITVYVVKWGLGLTLITNVPSLQIIHYAFICYEVKKTIIIVSIYLPSAVRREKIHREEFRDFCTSLGLSKKTEKNDS